MAAGDWWGQHLLGLGAMQSQQQQHAYGFGQGIYAAGSAGTAGTINVGYQAFLSPAPAVKAKAPESAIEWLDRRVDEMRVSL